MQPYLILSAHDDREGTLGPGSDAYFLVQVFLSTLA